MSHLGIANRLSNQLWRKKLGWYAWGKVSAWCLFLCHISRVKGNTAQSYNFIPMFLGGKFSPGSGFPSLSVECIGKPASNARIIFEVKLFKSVNFLLSEWRCGGCGRQHCSQRPGARYLSRNSPWSRRTRRRSWARESPCPVVWSTNRACYNGRKTTSGSARTGTSAGSTGTAWSAAMKKVGCSGIGWHVRTQSPPSQQRTIKVNLINHVFKMAR